MLYSTLIKYGNDFQSSLSCFFKQYCTVVLYSEEGKSTVICFAKDHRIVIPYYNTIHAVKSMNRFYWNVLTIKS